MRDEIVEMVGRPVYELAATLLTERAKRGKSTVLPHPATR